MDNYALFTKSFLLKDMGIENAKIQYQLTPNELHEITIQSGQGVESSTGALAINTGKFTGRSPQDRFIVKDTITEDKVWWGNVNIPFEPTAFESLHKKVTAYLSNKEIFVRDSYVCADTKYRLKVRIVTETAWANFAKFAAFANAEILAGAPITQ